MQHIKKNELLNKETDKKDSDLLFNDNESIPGDSEAIEKSLHISKPWKVIIADDDIQVHSSTRIVLSDLIYDDRKINFISAYSASELVDVLKDNPDAAVVLLDVVMESTSAGLDIIKVIREELKNTNIRIILRTGQPGHAPEKKVVMEYDINDYKEKNELTSQKLFTTVYSALRAYKDIVAVKKGREAVRFILDASDDLVKTRSVNKMADKSLEFIHDLAQLLDSENIPVKSFSALLQEDKINILSKKGDLTETDEISDSNSDIYNKLINYSHQRKHYFEDQSSSYLISPAQFKKHLIYLKDFKPESLDEKQLLTLINEKIGIAFENLFLNNEIINTQIELIQVLGEIIENRSHETAYHVTRVSKMTEIIMKKMGFSDEDTERYSHASPLHDVGKIGIPDSILLKPGKLTDIEFDKIKTHTSIGYKLLSSSSKELLKTAALIALQHHEKWNGKGYPNGLKKNEIDRVSRIVSLVDVFDALSNDRIYKKAWETGKVLQYIEDEKEISFDPEVVETFFSNWEEIKDIIAVYKD